MPFVYVLKSLKDLKLYIGSTRGSIRDRIKRHNNGGVVSTRGRMPFIVLYQEEFISYKEARKRELYFKSGSGRESLRRILDNRAGTQVAKGDRL